VPNKEHRFNLAEAAIAERLRHTHQEKAAISMDGDAGMYENLPLRCAAVLIPLIRWKDEWHLVFTRRTDEVEHHKGQVSFPGGGCDLNETAPEETALREAWEEIGLRPKDVRLLGRLNDMVTITGYRVTPVVGVMPWPYELRLEPAEVVRVFTIPLSWLAGRGNWEEQPYTPAGIPRPIPVVKYREYDGELLWGVSARITLNFLFALGLIKK